MNAQIPHDKLDFGDTSGLDTSTNDIFVSGNVVCCANTLYLGKEAGRIKASQTTSCQLSGIKFDKNKHALWS